MSHVDTSIYQNLMQRVAPESPMDMATKAASLSTALTRAKAAPLDLEQTRLENENLRQKAQTSAEDRADEQTLQQLYGEVQNDKTVTPDKKLEELRSRAAGKVKPRTLENLSKQIEAHSAELQKLHDEDLKQAKTVAEEVGNTAAGILSAPADQQPALYAQERARLIRDKVATDDHIPEQFDAGWLQTAATHAMGAKNAADAELSRRKDERDKRDSDRKDRVAELATAGQTIDSVTDQDSYTKWRNGLSDANKALTAATFTPANKATIKRMALTAQEQQQADDRAATLAETTRHNTATEEKKPDAKTYTGELRAALVASGAKDPDNPSKEEAAAALKLVKPGATGQATKAQLTSIETRKTTAIRNSKAKLDKDLAGATVGGKVIDQAAVDQAWDDHIERLQDAQTGYENELTTATGSDVGHNDWADRLGTERTAQVKAKPADGAAATQPAATPAAGTPKPQAAAPTATNAKGEKVMWNGTAWVPFKPPQ